MRCKWALWWVLWVLCYFTDKCTSVQSPAALTNYRHPLVNFMQLKVLYKVSASFTSQTAAYLRFKNLWNLSLLFFLKECIVVKSALLYFVFFVCLFPCFTARFLYEIELFETGFLSHGAPALLGSFWWLFINVLHLPEFAEKDKFSLLMIHSLTYFFIGLRSIYTILYSNKLAVNLGIANSTHILFC